MRHVIATSRGWHEWLARALAEKTGDEFVLITRKEDLTPERLDEIQPTYVFFPHWSYLIPESIHGRFECVIFHMTDVPFGRGGSPLQNLIARGIYDTRMTALRCTSGLDAGPVYLKRPLSLHGSAEEIFLRASHVTGEMIETILAERPTPVPQTGEAVTFPRRTSEESNLAPLETLDQVFDYIRMLDCDGYPPAFLEAGRFRLEFRRAARRDGRVEADVMITEKPHE